MSGRVQRLVAALTIVALLGPLAAVAAAKSATSVTPYRSVGPVTLGMTRARVQRTLGRPAKVTRGGGVIVNWLYPKRHLLVSFQTGTPAWKVDLVTLTGGAWHTAGGIHNGSTLKALQRVFRGLACAATPSVRVCTLAPKTQARKGLATVFRLAHGRVYGVEVSAGESTVRA